MPGGSATRRAFPVTARSPTLALLGALLLGSGNGHAASPTSLAIMTPEQATDFGWNQQGVEAARAVAAKYGLKFTAAQGLGYGDVRATLRELADDGASLIIAHASGYNTSAVEIAQETHVPVAIVDSPRSLAKGLVADYTLSGYEGAYLAGMLAARMSHGDSVGIVVSGEPPAWVSQSYGFVEGARHAEPALKIRYAVIGPAAYSDAAGARRVTDAVLAAGADVIFGQGNGASFGMLQAVEAARQARGADVWFIDVIGDKSSIDHGSLLSSVVWDYTPVFDRMVQDLMQANFGEHDYRLSLSGDSIHLLRTSHIPAELWADLMTARADIIAGRLKVDEVYDAAKLHELIAGP